MSVHTLITAGVFILILSFLVIIHELGHFFAAKWARVKVEEFGLGYPPLALKLFRWWGSDFTLNWIPFGGFVRMEGEDEAFDGKTEWPKRNSPEVPFFMRPSLHRLVVIVAGAAVNIVFAVISFTVVFSILGIPVQSQSPRISQIAAGSPAEKSGLQIGSEVRQISVGEEKISLATVPELVEFVAAHRGETAQLQVTGVCQGEVCPMETKTVDIYLRKTDETPADQGALGLSFDGVVFVKDKWYIQPFKAVVYGVTQSVAMVLLILGALAGLVTEVVTKGVFPSQLSGPVGIVAQAQREGIFSQGPLSVLGFAGMLSLNLGVMNLLPIPALDGGRALFILLEWLIGRHRTASIEGKLHYVGFVVLVSLIVLVTLRDIWMIL
jgi:regulator of sigma E protease